MMSTWEKTAVCSKLGKMHQSPKRDEIIGEASAAIRGPRCHPTTRANRTAQSQVGRNRRVKTTYRRGKTLSLVRRKGRAAPSEPFWDGRTGKNSRSTGSNRFSSVCTFVLFPSATIAERKKIICLSISEHPRIQRRAFERAHNPPITDGALPRLSFMTVIRQREFFNKTLKIPLF